MSLTEKTIDINYLEKEIYRKCFEQGRAAMAALFEKWDEELRQDRDKEKYRHKGKRCGVYRMIFGEVEYLRNVYEVWDDGMKVGHAYLLDEAIGISDSRRMSGILRELIAKVCCEGSYRAAARVVSEMTGQSLSHTGAWNVVQALGEEIDGRELQAAELAAKDKGVGTTAAAVLFEEQDGIHLKLQGKSRKAHGSGKEMKIAIAYDGTEKKGKKRYELTTKVACANFEDIDEFVKRKEGAIGSVYAIDEIEIRFLGGDGAGWVRRSQTDETVHFQLDQFHRNKAVTKLVASPDAKKAILKLLYAKEMDVDLLLHVIETEALSTDDEKERDNYMELHTYFQNNRDGLVPYQRRGLDIPAPPEGKSYRGMGAMESNVFTIIGNRMKGGRCLWSISGGNNLARLLCLYHTKRLSAVIDGIGNHVLPERYEKEVAVKTSAANVPQREGKGYDGFHHYNVPSAQKGLKDIARIKPVYSF